MPNMERRTNNLFTLIWEPAKNTKNSTAILFNGKDKLLSFEELDYRRFLVYAMKYKAKDRRNGLSVYNEKGKFLGVYKIRQTTK